ncbi:MAG TPA: hypothetical protein VE871_01405 [Longimicrobium sp.]|nr:hypothetical protein [Longimicrobium sp.]
MRVPSNPTKVVEKDGYRASFYPGFVRRLAVLRDGVELELYNQDPTEPFFLPPGYDKPWPSSVLEFSAPSPERRILLQIDDPGQQIGRIEIRFKKPEAAPSGSLLSAVGDAVDSLLGDPPCAGEGEGEFRLIIEDAPVLCPPICPIET